MAKIRSRQVIQDYQEARASLGLNTESGIEDYMALKGDVLNLISNATYSAYGIMSMSSPSAFPDIGASFQKVDVFDNLPIANQKGVISNLGNSSITTDSSGIYLVTISISLEHNSLNSGRATSLRLSSDMGPVTGSFPVGIGRNVEITSSSISFLAQVNSDFAGKEIWLEIGGGDVITSVNFVTAIINIISVGDSLAV